MHQLIIMLSATMLDNIHSHNTRKKHQKKTTSLLQFHRNKPKSVCSVMDQKSGNEIPLQIKEMNFCKFKIEFKRKLISAY